MGRMPCRPLLPNPIVSLLILKLHLPVTARFFQWDTFEFSEAESKIHVLVFALISTLVYLLDL